MKVIAVMVHAPRGTAGAADQSPDTGLGNVADLLAAARGVAGTIVRVAIPPGVDPGTLAALGAAAGQVMRPKGDAPGDCQRAVFQELFRRGAKQALLVGSDGPPLTSAILEHALTALEQAPGRVVLGPSSGGGYYLLGLAAPQVPDLFTGVRSGTKYTLMDTLRRCEFEERRVTFLPMLDALPTDM